MFTPRQSRLRHLAFAALLLLVLLPFAASRTPYFGDGLNHLARMHVLDAIGRSTALQRFYSVDWRPIPYLAMDAVVPLLARIVPIYTAGKIFVCLCVLMPALATTALHASIHRRFSLVPAASLLLCTNMLLGLGFLNYLFASGLAVLLFAFWLHAETWRRWRRAALFTPLLTLLYLGHAFAALAYCLCVAGREATRALRARPADWRATIADVIAAAAQAVPALLLASSLDVGAGYVGGLNTEYGNPLVKLLALASPILLLIDATHILTAAAAAVCLTLLCRHIRLSPRVWPACLAVTIAAIAMPHVVASTWGMDLRLPLVAAMLFLGGLSFPRDSTRRWPALGLLAVLLAVRAADDWSALRQIDAGIASTRLLLDRLPRGTRLLVASTTGHGTGLERIPANTNWHMPLVALIDRDAFVPTLFTGLTTVQVRPDFRLSSTPNGLPISLEQLRQGATDQETGIERGDGLGARLYFHGWPAKFDNVLILHPDGPPTGLPPNLSRLAGTPAETLYAVVKPP